MALVTCPECESQVSTDAKACPKCGSTKIPRGWSTGKILIAGVFILIVGSCVMGQVRQAADPAAAAESQRRAAETLRVVRLQRECKDAVTNRLKAPSTAEFPGEIEIRQKKDEPTFYYGLGKVDAQNGFGAKLRQTFVCKMRGIGEPLTVTVIDVEIG